jgi:hypothetical protein
MTRFSRQFINVQASLRVTHCVGIDVSRLCDQSIPDPAYRLPKRHGAKVLQEWSDITGMSSMEWNLGSENPKKIPEHSVGVGRVVSGKDLIAYRNDALRRYDRQTMWVASGLLICTILAAVVVALRVPEKNAAGHAMEENLVSDDAAVNSNPTTLSGVRSVNEKSASSEMSPGQTISIDRTDTVISPGQNSPPPTESPVPGQTPASAPTSETYQPETQADTGPMSPVQRKDTARVIRPNIRNLRHRRHGHLRLDVKSRLVALWHESLWRSQQPRSWVAPWYLK